MALAHVRCWAVPSGRDAESQLHAQRHAVLLWLAHRVPLDSAHSQGATCLCSHSCHISLVSSRTRAAACNRSLPCRSGILLFVIAQGGEATIAYTELAATGAERRAALLTNYHFDICAGQVSLSPCWQPSASPGLEWRSVERMC